MSILEDIKPLIKQIKSTTDPLLSLSKKITT